VIFLQLMCESPHHVACQPSNYHGISGRQPNSRCLFHVSYHFKNRPHRNDHSTILIFLFRAFYYRATPPNKRGRRPTYRRLCLEFYCRSKNLCKPTRQTTRRYPLRVFILFCTIHCTLISPTKFLSLSHPEDHLSTSPHTCFRWRCSKFHNHSLYRKPILLRKHHHQHERKYLSHALNYQAILPHNEPHQARAILRTHVFDYFSTDRCIQLRFQIWIHQLQSRLEVLIVFRRCQLTFSSLLLRTQPPWLALIFLCSLYKRFLDVIPLQIHHPGLSIPN